MVGLNIENNFFPVLGFNSIHRNLNDSNILHKLLLPPFPTHILKITVKAWFWTNVIVLEQTQSSKTEKLDFPRQSGLLYFDFIKPKIL